MFRDLRRQVPVIVEWQDLLGRALRDRSEGMFNGEFVQWLIDAGEMIDGRPIVRDYETGVLISEIMSFHEHLGLITFTIERPTRVYQAKRKVMITPLPEPCSRLSKRGLAFAEWPRWRKHLYIGWRYAWAASMPLRTKLKLPIALMGAVITLTKVFLQWPTLQAGAATALTGILAFAAAALRGRA